MTEKLQQTIKFWSDEKLRYEQNYENRNGNMQSMSYLIEKIETRIERLVNQLVEIQNKELAAGKQRSDDPGISACSIDNTGPGAGPGPGPGTDVLVSPTCSIV
jgi:hypothetical protein